MYPSGRVPTTTATNVRVTIAVTKSRHITLTIATRVLLDESPDDDENMDVDEGKSTASSDADNNFAVALKPPEKNAKRPQCNTVVVEKETAALCKRKAIIPCKRNKKIIESDSDKNDDDNFLTSCGRTLDRDPLNI